MDGDELQSKYKFDYNRGLVYQLWTSDISHEDYIQWVNEPKHIINPVRDVVLFDNYYLENYLAKTPWFVIPFAWCPIMFYYFSINTLTFLPTVFAVLYGIFCWTLMEYLLHRWVFHSEDHWYLPANKHVYVLHFLTHGIHHCFPMDRYRLVFPPINGYILYLISFKPIYETLWPELYLPGICAGTIIGYMFYDMGHYFMHHSTPKKGYFRNVKVYHLQHHYKNGKAGFGVSSKFWDIIFRTEL